MVVRGMFASTHCRKFLLSKFLKPVMRAPNIRFTFSYEKLLFQKHVTIEICLRFHLLPSHLRRETLEMVKEWPKVLSTLRSKKLSTCHVLNLFIIIHRNGRRQKHIFLARCVASGYDWSAQS